MKVKALFLVAGVLLGGIGGTGLAQARPISPPLTVDTLAHAGAPCERSTSGGLSWDQDDLSVGIVCSRLPDDDRYLWRPLDSSRHPYVGSIDRLYGAYFRRAPDAGGFAYWIRLYLRPERPLSLGLISDLFATSPEFQAATREPDLVGWAYRTVLDRAPDAVGHGHWSRLLASGRITPGQLVVFFSESPEFKAKTQTV